MIEPETLKDHGFKSRKLAFSIFTILCVFAGLVLAGFWPTIQPMYDTLVGGVVAIAGLYLAGNIGQRFVATRTQPLMVQSYPGQAYQPQAYPYQPQPYGTYQAPLYYQDPGVAEPPPGPPPPRFPE
jgi:hypothetical protein